MAYTANQEAAFGWDLEDYSESPCPACGESIDYCQGHGLIGDEWGARILAMHDDDNHTECHPASDCHEESE
jgi:hypothetical protein